MWSVIGIGVAVVLTIAGESLLAALVYVVAGILGGLGVVLDLADGLACGGWWWDGTVVLDGGSEMDDADRGQVETVPL